MTALGDVMQRMSETPFTDADIVDDYLANGPRARFLGAVLRLYEAEQQDNPTNPSTTLAKRLGVNAATLTGWVQAARRARA